MEQIHVEGEDDIDDAEVSPVSLSMPVLKEMGLNGSLKWLNISVTIHSSLQINFERAGITGALSGAEARMNSRLVHLISVPVKMKMILTFKVMIRSSDND